MDRQIVVCDAEPHVVRAISLEIHASRFRCQSATEAESCWRLLHGHEPHELLIVSDELPADEDSLQLISPDPRATQNWQTCQSSF